MEWQKEGGSENLLATEPGNLQTSTQATPKSRRVIKAMKKEPGERMDRSGRGARDGALSLGGGRSSPPPQHWQKVGIFYYDADRLHPRQVQRLQEIRSYFTSTKVNSILMPVAKAEFDVSLRLLDYCCTNYAKKTRVVICEEHQTIHLFSLYKDWLRHYRRRTFDPFRRRERICFRPPTSTTEWLETTVAQLNFIRWADLYGVIRFVRRNSKAIERDMMRTLYESKQRGIDLFAASAPVAINDKDKMEEGAPTSGHTEKRKRAELSRNPTAKCVVYLVPQSILFEDD